MSVNHFCGVFNFEIYFQSVSILFIGSAWSYRCRIVKNALRTFLAGSCHQFGIFIIGEKEILSQIPNVPFVRRHVGHPSVSRAIG